MEDFIDKTQKNDLLKIKKYLYEVLLTRHSAADFRHGTGRRIKIIFVSHCFAEKASSTKFVRFQTIF